MPRPLRVHIPGAFHHVTLRGNHQQVIFRDDADRLMLNSIVGRALETYGARLHAYCWMTNHLHLLVEVGNDPLSSLMRQIASEYARRHQRRLTTTGHLFERRYHGKIIDVDTYLLTLLRYIHLNPVAAGLCATPDGHRWSSHHAYAGGAPERWLTVDFGLAMFSRTRSRAFEAYRRFMECDPIGEGLQPAAAETMDHRPAAPMRVSAANSTRQRQGLQALVSEACRRFDVTFEQLGSSSRDAYLVQVRAWVANQALTRRIANLSEVARLVGRDRSSLRSAMKRYPGEIT